MKQQKAFFECLTQPSPGSIKIFTLKLFKKEGLFFSGRSHALRVVRNLNLQTINEACKGNYCTHKLLDVDVL